MVNPSIWTSHNSSETTKSTKPFRVVPPLEEQHRMQNTQDVKHNTTDSGEDWHHQKANDKWISWRRNDATWSDCVIMMMCCNVLRTLCICLPLGQSLAFSGSSPTRLFQPKINGASVAVTMLTSMWMLMWMQMMSAWPFAIADMLNWISSVTWCYNPFVINPNCNLPHLSTCACAHQWVGANWWEQWPMNSILVCHAKCINAEKAQVRKAGQCFDIEQNNTLAISRNCSVLGGKLVLYAKEFCNTIPPYDQLPLQPINTKVRHAASPVRVITFTAKCCILSVT